jgi:hypothetical protein
MKARHRRLDLLPICRQLKLRILALRKNVRLALAAALLTIGALAGAHAAEPRVRRSGSARTRGNLRTFI